jgi:hypothetical protein
MVDRRETIDHSESVGLEQHNELGAGQETGPQPEAARVSTCSLTLPSPEGRGGMRKKEKKRWM